MQPRSKVRHSLFKEMEVAVPQFRPHIVFDVGANVGQSTARYLAAWPGCQVVAFEPISETFAVLQSAFEGRDDVTCEKVALGARSGAEAMMSAAGVSTMNAILPEGRTKGPSESVAVRAGDDYCRDRAIDRISFLKVDTEGHDFEVLQGFSRMIAEARIDFLQVEVGMNPANQRHVPLRRFADWLEPQGYYVFGVHDQVQERTGRVMMRRANVVFVGDTPALRRDLAG